jgi:2-dehydro-3-deoxyphosphogluconate aldolase/(4S)-4-hydroxy-2-oxoglutarate aldolase
MSRARVVSAIEELGAIAILRLDDSSRLPPVVDALAAGDVRLIEVTMTMPAALEAIGALSKGGKLMIGAGTILDAETARLAILAGARFIVAPTFQPEVVEMCHRYDVVAIPGALTPTEIFAAWEAGAELVKLFPASSVGPSYLKDVRGPLPQVRLVATGGISFENAGAFLQAGAVAVGVGGALVDKQAIARGDYARITEEARRLTQAVRAARGRDR